GLTNSALGFAAAVPGGQGNHADGNFSFAGGLNALASHSGSFVWADSTGAAYGSSANDQFCVRANGGLRLEGPTWLHDHDLYLRGYGDSNHGIGYRGTVDGSYIDGPFVFGYNAGALGTRDPDDVAL